MDMDIYITLTSLFSSSNQEFETPCLFAEDSLLLDASDSTCCKVKSKENGDENLWLKIINVNKTIRLKYIKNVKVDSIQIDNQSKNKKE